MDVRDTDAAQHRDTYAPQGSCVVDDPNFPVILSSDDKLDIICEWQHQMTLICKCPHQPVNSLANFQYYGHERLPIDIRGAFTSALIFDLMLISHARASQVTHFYMYKPSSTQFLAEEEASQQYNKGNVAVRPQNLTELRNLLPPSGDELCDAMCVIFSGQKQIPSRETIKKLQPMMVMKSRVQKLIRFLIDNNPWYQRSGVVYSQVNMDALFDEVDHDMDTSVLRALAICHLPSENRESTDEDKTRRHDKQRVQVCPEGPCELKCP
ncbi:hypothetical protein EDB19DRAFT_1635618 [Suillus lakei]|nr:hypothetical protein EDB19DRAFT_1635618 [Suillus lakei]